MIWHSLPSTWQTGTPALTEVCSSCIDDCLNRVIFINEKDVSKSQNLKVERHLTSHPFFCLPFSLYKCEERVKHIFRLHSGNFLCSLPQHHRISVKCSSVKTVCSLPLAVLSHFAPKEGITEEEKLETFTAKKTPSIFGIFTSQEKLSLPFEQAQHLQRLPKGLQA